MGTRRRCQAYCGGTYGRGFDCLMIFARQIGHRRQHRKELVLVVPEFSGASRTSLQVTMAKDTHWAVLTYYHRQPSSSLRKRSSSLSGISLRRPNLTDFSLP